MGLWIRHVLECPGLPFCNHGPDTLPRVLFIHFKILSCRRHEFGGLGLMKALLRGEEPG